MCKRAVAEAGVHHVVVAKSESGEAGTIKMLRFNAFPVMPVSLSKIRNLKIEVLDIPTGTYTIYIYIA